MVMYYCKIQIYFFFTTDLHYERKAQKTVTLVVPEPAFFGEKYLPRKSETHAMLPAMAVDVSHFCAYKVAQNIWFHFHRKISSFDVNLAF